MLSCHYYVIMISYHQTFFMISIITHFPILRHAMGARDGKSPCTTPSFASVTGVRFPSPVRSTGKPSSINIDASWTYNYEWNSLPTGVTSFLAIKTN